METIPYSRQWIDEEDLEAVCRVLRSDWVTQGPTVASFEKGLAERAGTASPRPPAASLFRARFSGGGPGGAVEATAGLAPYEVRGRMDRTGRM